MIFWTLIYLLLAFTVLIVLWAISIRPRIRDKAWAKPFFDAVEPYEIAIYKKSETILLARFKIVTGALLALLTSLGGIDITPLMPLVPDDWEKLVQVAFNLLPLAISALGWIDEQMRKDTTTPLEVVAAPSTPAMEEAKTVIAEANKEAKVVAATEAVKAES